MFDWKKPTVQMLGRWQPWHQGHQELFKRCVEKTGQVIEVNYKKNENASVTLKELELASSPETSKNSEKNDQVNISPKKWDNTKMLER